MASQVIGLPEMSGFDTEAIPSVLWLNFAVVLIIPQNTQNMSKTHLSPLLKWTPYDFTTLYASLALELLKMSGVHSRIVHRNQHEDQ